MKQLENQIAVVTGAGRGIGRAIALKFAAEGADVVCVSRTAENSEKVAAEVRALGRKAWAYAVDVAEGDYLLAVNGRELRAPTNPYQLFEQTSGRATYLSVNDSPARNGAREVLVEPVASEGQLRNWDWIEGNRRRVDELSNGKLAYVYVPNTGSGGFEYFNRYNHRQLLTL